MCRVERLEVGSSVAYERRTYFKQLCHVAFASKLFNVNRSSSVVEWMPAKGMVVSSFHDRFVGLSMGGITLWHTVTINKKINILMYSNSLQTHSCRPSWVTTRLLSTKEANNGWQSALVVIYTYIGTQALSWIVLLMVILHQRLVLIISYIYYLNFGLEFYF